MKNGHDIEPGWARWLLGSPGLWAAGAWGFAEGTLFFVVPDVLFTLTTLLRPRRGLLQLGAVIIGATLAGGAMYMWSAARPAQARAAVANVPFVGEAMISRFEVRLALYGTAAMFDEPLGGVPYKVYAVVAPRKLSLREFLLLSIPARAERMLITWIPAALMGLAVRRLEESLRRRAAVWLHAIAWIAIYAVYWGKLWPQF